MSLVHYGPVTAWEPELPMEERHASELAAMGVVRVEPVRAPAEWRIIPDSKVGVLVGEGWELRIRPRLAIPKLLFLLAYSEKPDEGLARSRGRVRRSGRAARRTGGRFRLACAPGACSWAAPWLHPSGGARGGTPRPGPIRRPARSRAGATPSSRSRLRRLHAQHP